MFNLYLPGQMTHENILYLGHRGIWDFMALLKGILLQSCVAYQFTLNTLRLQNKYFSLAIFAPTLKYPFN